MKTRMISAAVILISLGAGAASLPQLAVPPVTRDSLGNGAKLILIKDASLPLTHLQFIFNQGAAHDPRGSEGLANLAGEMLLRGTRSFPKEKLRAAFETKGASASVSVGAKETIVNLSTLTEALPGCMQLIRSVMMERESNARELSLAKNEIVESIKSFPDRGGPFVSSIFKSFVDVENPYGRFPDGKISSIGKITLVQVRAFQDTVLRGGNLTIAGTSDMDVEALKKLLHETFESLPAGATPEIKVPELKPWSGIRALVLDKKKQETMNIIFGHPATWAGSTERVQLVVSNYMFGQAPLISALFREVRSNRGWTYGINSNYSFQPYRGPFSIYLFPTRKFGLDAFKLSLEMYSHYVTLGVPPSDLNYAKTALINQAPFLFETSEDVLNRVLDEEIRGTPKGFYENFVRRVDAVNTETSNSARSKAHKVSGMLAVVMLGDAKEIVPALRKMPDVKSIEVKSAYEVFK